METFVYWCGFLGAWLLFAGPIYQAAVELGEEEFQREHLEALSQRVPPPEPVSFWWWLLPPVAYVLRRQRSGRYRRTVFDTLSQDELEGFVHYTQKATGWLLVGAGAFLIAFKETWELVEHSEWPHAAFWGLVVLMTALATGNAVLRITRSEGMVRAKQG